MAPPVVIIPARLGSERFPRKVLADETGTPLIVHVCEAAAKVRPSGGVYVAADSGIICDAVRTAGFEALLTSTDHPNGTSRLAEAADLLGLPDDQIVINIQGDEPEIDAAAVSAAAEALRSGSAEMSTLASPFRPGDRVDSPDVVKIVLARPEGKGGDNASGNVRRALYFSRAAVPYIRDASAAADVGPFRHIGLYCYRAGFLRRYATLEPTPLERAERLEQLRVLEHGYSIVAAMAEASWDGVDTAEDYAKFVARKRSAGG